MAKVNFDFQSQQKQASINLRDATVMPLASAYLFNPKLSVQANCQGYLQAQFMQPEPGKYSRAPNIEATTFMQPEMPYFAHAPGRFVYIKDEDTGEIFSAPHQPCRQKAKFYRFRQGMSSIQWCYRLSGIEVLLTLQIDSEDICELYTLEVKNLGKKTRRISIYPYFSIGYMSWMNQQAQYTDELEGIVATSITPYQKVDDYFVNQELKDKTYLLTSKKPYGYCANQQKFEGDGHLSMPDALKKARLANDEAIYETPLACLQYRQVLNEKQVFSVKMVFGPAKDADEIEAIKAKYIDAPDGFSKASERYQVYQQQAQQHFVIDSPDDALNQFVNSWLPRQIFYHDQCQRLTTDPQTRNYLQDSIGIAFINAEQTRKALLHAVSQQHRDGRMPDGILIEQNATLKYINQVPHADHCVWLPLTLQVYLDETNDSDILQQHLAFGDSAESVSFAEHVELAMQYLLDATDDQGLSYIAQGDWCDPMNMVGYKGKGVSAWLSLATSYAIKTWCYICKTYLPEYPSSKLAEFEYASQAINKAVNKVFWDGGWYARGKTDDDVIFGCKNDVEGSIYLNPQSFAILSGAATPAKRFTLLHEVMQRLHTPYGVMMLAPAYTGMRDDIGRITQKFPGSAENGSIYNHASAFYAYSLLQIGEASMAYDVLRKMIPDENDALIRGQLPNFIPNYYRGAYLLHPEYTGRSSQLINTGTIAWVYRCIIEHICGLKGEGDGLRIDPNLPQGWNLCSGSRNFRGAYFTFNIRRSEVKKTRVHINNVLLNSNVFRAIEAGKHYMLDIEIPRP
ncbi:NdvB protein [Thalassotalea sp. Y01]|uniref:GH36-type glycosyl hydrolase domain-containing protein n=1 Tax=Thalassotalea sp. Y01 TaxID=2729613 RepID=UPI00145EAD9E|nr:NdvB protein [Thalassotalea sp. Y01]NMP16376.1 NdvB protein [Thalassotalea sp. Y01]